MSNLKLKTRILVSVCCVVVISYLITITYVTIKSYRMAKEEAMQITAEMAARYGSQVSLELENAITACRTMANILEGTIKRPETIDRATIDNQLKEILKDNPMLFGAWAAFEPNQLDGRDQEFADAAHQGKYGKQGIYSRYFWMQDKDAKGAYDGNFEKAWFQRPKQLNAEFILDPLSKRNQEDEIKVTIGVPIKKNASFIGTVGVSIKLTAFEALIDSIRPFDTGHGFLVAHNGFIVAHPQKALISKSLHDLVIDETIQQAVKDGKKIDGFALFGETGQSSYSVYVPVKIGKTNTPWSFAISIPEATILENARSIRNVTILISLVSLVVLILVIYLIVQNIIVTPLKQVVAFAKTLKTGDLSVRLPVGRDEIGEMGDALNSVVEEMEAKAEVASHIADGNLNLMVAVASEQDVLGESLQTMINSLNSVINEILQTIIRVDINSSELYSSSNMLAEGAVKQAASLEQITASITEVNARTKINAEHATYANQLTALAMEACSAGEQQMRSMASSVQEISESGKRIGQIIRSIDEIAFQTNILSLNAAIEAAHAGVHGKGFSVVAGEVRSLAGKCAEAAAQTVVYFEQIERKLITSSDTLVTTQKSFADIQDRVRKVTELISEIAVAGNDEALALSEIKKGLDQIETITQQNTASAEETSAAAKELAAEASQVRSLMARFDLKTGNSLPETVLPSIGCV